METTQNAQSQEVDVSSVYLPDHCRDVSPEGQDKINRDIREKGLIQEIVVAEMPDGRKELVAGQRRFKAVQALGWQKVRARVLPMGVSELDKTLITIAENEEREDVSPIDKALSYKRAIEVGHLEKQKFAELRGMSNAAVSQYLALAELPADQRVHFSQLKLDLAHISEILRLASMEDQAKLAQETSKEGLTSKEVRRRVNQLLKPAGAEASAKPVGEVKPIQFSWKNGDLVIKAVYKPQEKSFNDFYYDIDLAYRQFVELHPAPAAQPKAKEVAQAA